MSAIYPVNGFLGRRRPEQPGSLARPRSRRKGHRSSQRIGAFVLLTIAFAFVSCLPARAAVSVSGASGGSAISADTAASGGSGAWTTLGPIIIDEAKKMDISSGSAVTLVLKAPAGFQFNTASTPSVSWAGGADIISASVTVTDPSTLTITMNVSGTGATDTLTVGSTGLQVRPTLGGPLPSGRHIYRPSSGGGTANINGITTSTDGSSGSNFGNLSEVPGTFVKLQLLMPGETASPGSLSGKTGSASAQIAGMAFNAIVNGVDANWNVVSGATGSGFTIHLVSSDSNATVPADADLTSGTRTFSGTFRTAGTATLTASDLDNGAITASSSPTINVNVGAFSRLQVLAPGEIAVPGTPSGKNGTPSLQTVGSPFLVNVNATDANWNPINTNDTVSISSSDTNAVVPPNGPLTGGSGSFSVTLKAAGSRTVSAGDITHGGISSGASGSIPTSPTDFVKLQLLLPGESPAPGSVSGKAGSPSPFTAGTGGTATINGVDQFWNLVSTVTDTVSIACSDLAATFPATAILINGTVSLSLTTFTSGNQTVSTTDVSDGTKSGATDIVIVNPAAATLLSLARQPSSSAVAGAIFPQQPVIFIRDAFNNVRSNDALVVTASLNTGIGILLGAASITSVNGVATFTNLACTGAGTSTIHFASGALAPTNSANIAISPGAYSKLQVLMPGEIAAPGTVPGKSGAPVAQAAGSVFNNLSVAAVDPWWNLVATNATVHISSSDANCTLPANSPLGSTGLKTNFSLTFRTAASQTVSAVDVGDSTKTNTGSVTTVNPGPFSKLQFLVPGETAVPGSAVGKVGSSLAQTSNVPFPVTVNSVDANWNLINTNDTIHFTSSDPSALLPTNSALVAGTRNLSITLITAGSNMTVTASDLTHAGITAGTSANLSVFSVPNPPGGPRVAVHDSEFTRALETLTAGPATPSGAGTTGKEWWTTNWHYFVMPEALKEALRSEGIPFDIISDADISNGRLLDTNGRPRYPILISLTSEAIASTEISQISSYVSAGGFVFAGGSAFTRNTDGTTRGDFAFSTEMGLHMVTPGLTNWRTSGTFTKVIDDRLISHIPTGTLNWEMPVGGDEISWGVYPHPSNPLPNALAWGVQPSTASVLANGASSPFLTENAFGKGHFIYEAAMEPLVAHGGWGPGMYAHMIFRKAIEWAFESARLPLPRISPWPYAYDSAFMVRHDLENYQNEISGVEASAQIESTNGVKADYFFCTGTLREEMSPTYNTNLVVGGLRSAITNYGATIGPHNGGLRNPFNNPALSTNSFDFWHWGPDEALDVIPSGWPSGKAYALASVSNSFLDIERWLPGLMTNGMRVWVAPYFDGTRENSFDIQAQLGVKISGEQKLTPFPHWTVSTATSGKRYSFLSIPVSDWFINGTVGQAMELNHTTNTVHALIDYYYSIGSLINLYSHTLCSGVGGAGFLPLEYITYCNNTNLHPRLWSANSIGIYNWWLQRSNAQMSVSYFATNADQAILSFAISGATDPNTSVEALIPGPGAYSGQVLTNGTVAPSTAYRVNGQIVKVRTGTSVTNAEIRYSLGPTAQPDTFPCPAPLLSVPAPGVLTNDLRGATGTNLTAILVTPPANGSVTLSNNGAFTYSQSPGFSGSDSFTYKVNDGIFDSAPATVTLLAAVPPGFSDDFTRGTDPGPLSPWVLRAGQWTVTGGELRGGTNSLQTYANVFLTNIWSDYSVQARLKLPVGSFGGGVGARLDAPSGRHYAAWVYPENSPGGSNVFRVIKFSDWSTWTQLAQVSLASVGTSFHTVKLAFQGNSIAAFFDGVQLLSLADDNVPYPNGGVSLDMWTDLVPYVLEVDDVLVAPLVADDSWNVAQNGVLNIPAPGVLTNDTEVYGTSLTAALVSTASHGALTLNPNGSFTYTPGTGFFGTDSFIYQANDGTTNLGTARVTINVINSNPAPVITSISLSNLLTTLTWSSISGRTYRLQYKTNLLDPAWIPVSPDLLATGLAVTATNSVGNASRRFYEVILLP